MSTWEKIKKILLSEKFLLLAIFSLGFLFSLPQISTPMVAEADAYYRSNLAQMFKDQKIFLARGGMWLPLYFNLMVFGLYLYGNIFFTPRFITLIFSLGSVVLIYKYTLIIQENKSKLSAAITTILFLVFPLRYYLSTQTLTEPVFLFFLLASLYNLFKKKPNYFIGLLALNIAHGIRYESWFLLPLLWLYFGSTRQSVTKKMAIIATSIIFPLIWLLSNYYWSGDPLFFVVEKLKMAQAYSKLEYGNVYLSFSVWWNTLRRIFPLIFTILGTLGLYKIFNKKINIKTLILGALPFYFFFLLIIQVYLGTMEWFPPRYLLIPIALFFPYVAFGITKIISFSNIRNIKGLMITLLFLLLAITYIQLFDTTNKYLQSFSNSYKNGHQDFIEILIFYKNYKKTYPEVNYEYYFDEREETHYYAALFYFTEKHSKQIRLKKDLFADNLEDNDILIVEKGINNINNDDYITLFENEAVLVLKSK